MPVIKKYHFGRMQIGQKEYSSDLIISSSGKIISGWRRKQGHLLDNDDISQLLDPHPDILVIGTGASGMMKVSDQLKQLLSGLSVHVEIYPTQKAVAVYNKKILTAKTTAACFHLTC